MRQFTCECPSGLALTMREFKVSDEDLVGNPKKNKKRAVQVTLLDAITVDLEDSGPYAFESKPNWLEALQGDIFYALMRARIETWGPELQYQAPCPRCRSVTILEINLEDFEVKKLPKSSIPHVQTNKPIEVVLPSSGTRVGFKLARGKDERAMMKIQKRHADNISSALLLYRVTNIEGVDPGKHREWIQDMSGRDVQYLRSVFDEYDCGVDTETQFECDTCDNVWIDDMRLGKDFLFPKLRGKTTTSATNT